jgi:hypothetical protein
VTISCPKCGGHRMAVRAVVWCDIAETRAGGWYAKPPHDPDHDEFVWNDASEARCRGCDYEGEVMSFDPEGRSDAPGSP